MIESSLHHCRLSRAWAQWAVALICCCLVGCRARTPRTTTLLNVSYDPTRELYTDYNAAFQKHWLAVSQEEVSFRQSHGGSGKQARAVMDGLEADVVTLALEYDVDAIAQRGLIAADWQKRLPSNSAPYTSTIVLVVRTGNPKRIRDFGDLARDGVSVITPNPKTGGGARLNYLAAWAYGLKAFAGDEQKTRELVGRIYENVAVLDSGARGSTTTFVERNIGDVLIAWENEALLALQELGATRLELVVPSISILAEPSVAVVDRFAKKHGTEAAARAYLEYLYAPESQELIARHHFRPRDARALARHRGEFKEIELVSVSALGGWQAVQAKHFSDGGIFDQIYERH